MHDIETRWVTNTESHWRLQPEKYFELEVATADLDEVRVLEVYPTWTRPPGFVDTWTMLLTQRAWSELALEHVSTSEVIGQGQDLFQLLEDGLAMRDRLNREPVTA